MAFRYSMQTLIKSCSTICSRGPSNWLNMAHQYKPTPLIRNYSSLLFKSQPSVCTRIKTPLHTQEPKQEYHILSKLPTSVFSSLHFQNQRLDAVETKRSVTKFSMMKGRRKTVKCITRRFYRLDWGIWIRPRSGRHKRLWKKGKLRREKLRQHVFCNAWQTRTLERMTTKYWHKKKYFVDDPYETYHTRPNFPITKNVKNIAHGLD